MEGRAAQRGALPVDLCAVAAALEDDRPGPVGVPAHRTGGAEH